MTNKKDKNIYKKFSASGRYIMYISIALDTLDKSSKKSVSCDMSDFKNLIDNDTGDYPKFDEDIVVKPLKRLGYRVSSVYKDDKPYLIIEDKKESKND